MDIIIGDQSELNARCEVLILPVFEGEGIGAYKTIDKALDGMPSTLASGRAAKFRARHGEVLVLQTYGHIKAAQVAFIGLGKRDELTTERVRQSAGKCSSALKNIADAALATGAIKDIEGATRAFAEGFMLVRYSFDRYKKDNDAIKCKSLHLLGLKAAWAKEVMALVEATHYARDLTTTPPKDMTPSVLASEAKKIRGLKVRVLDRKASIKLGMGAYAAVAAGSHEEPRFIVAEYKGAKKKAAPIVLIGKSVTFDSGGLSLKPSDSMEHMKYDMAGGAAVLGVMKAVISMKLPLDIVAILPATENLPGGSATRPGDVVRTIGGKTVEILNTDAEGRLTLADALGYAKKFHKPRAIIDIATLTGACAIALGGEAMGLMGNDESLQATLEAASASTGERAWRMPLYDEHDELIKSDIADLKNVGAGRMGGALTAGRFLQAFAGDTPWAHLDIAGTAWTDTPRPYVPKGATAIGVRLLYDALQRLK